MLPSLPEVQSHAASVEETPTMVNIDPSRRPNDAEARFGDSAVNESTEFLGRPREMILGPFLGLGLFEEINFYLRWRRWPGSPIRQRKLTNGEGVVLLMG